LNTCDSIRFRWEGDSNEIDEGDSQRFKHDTPRISIYEGIIIVDELEKSRINF
jgi:hypothetical protein